MTTHQKKFLNVVYEEIPKEIELGEIERIGQLQNLIKADFGDAIPVASAFIQLYKPHSDEQIATMADFQAIPEEYFIEGGLALEIRTSPPPQSATQPSVKDVVDEFLSELPGGSIRSKSEEDIAAHGSADSGTPMEIDGAAEIEELVLLEREATPLYDPRIKERLAKLEIQMPYERISQQCFDGGSVTVLAGVSGCGKSRTCIDIGLHHKSLYIDCYSHRDFKNMCEMLEKEDGPNDFLKETAVKYFYALVVARVSLLNHLKPATMYRFLSLQCSASFQSTSKFFMMELLRCSAKELSLMVEKSLTGSNKFTCLFDEAQILIEKMKNRFKSSAGQSERPLLRVLVETVSTMGACSFWCGTALRLKDISIFLTGVAKRSEVSVFTDFQHYTFEDIKKLIELYAEEPDYTSLRSATPAALLKACYFLQGRPRLITTFMEWLEIRKQDRFETVLEEYVKSQTKFVEGTDALTLSSFWQRVLDYAEILRDIQTGDSMDSKTPGEYCIDILANYLFSAPKLQACEVLVDVDDADLISTALVSLKRPLALANSIAATYWLTEPLVLEAAVNVFINKKAARMVFMKHCTKLILGPPTQWALDASSRGKMLDKFVGLRFRMGWWKEIPQGDAAWNEIPESFRRAFVHLPTPRFIAIEDSVDDGFFAMTCGKSESEFYVLPANKTGPDGFYRFIGYCGKSSFTKRGKQGHFYVSSNDRIANLKYTDLNEWYGSFANKETRIRPYLEMNSTSPFLFFCGEFPFYGSIRTKRPVMRKVGNNWVVRLDLTSRLGCYLLGKEAVEAISEWLPADQRHLVASPF
ncbi:hypothetical protein MP638_000468 [Amoeboaphelidium occidentale]|nr:hypothetical protein MP638_000468 [Amoeboaphelidium occidentale]